ncbi:MAG TPA: DNA polymerase IV [Actinomycetota bacterium]|nr:DNA polymerase IV [Actinomycetota bacterium]
MSRPETAVPEAERWPTPVLHADLDAFYASVEILKNPSLAGKPVIVGGTSSRGVVTSASYEARRFGVTSAMPTSRARRLCPHGIFVSPDFEAYPRYSRMVREVFDSFSPVVEPLALDEAFLDLRGASRMWPGPDGPVELARALRHAVTEATGLVVSAGLAPNKFLAKLASRRAKPDGLVLVEPDRVEAFLHPLPAGELWGVGERTKELLDRLGLRTIGDIAAVPPETLTRALGSLGTQIAKLAAGIDDRRVVADPPRKSVGAEETFERDLVADEEIARGLLGLADRVSSRLRGQGISGRTITVKVRYASFVTVTRARTLAWEVDSTAPIYATARSLCATALKASATSPSNVRVRLLGVSVGQLGDWPASEQISLEGGPRWPAAEGALDEIRRRFGDHAVQLGTLLP